MSKLWLVEIHEDDFEYGCFVGGVVWAETAEEAEQLIREAGQMERNSKGKLELPHGDMTRFVVTLAPVTGIAHTHWHAG